MRKDSLLFHRGFRRLWLSATLSQFGTSGTHAILPLLAATTLAASPFEMGLLTAAEGAAFLLLGLPAGVWVDCMRRRPVMLCADLARAVLLFSVPISWWAGVLTLAQLLVVALLLSIATLFFDVADQSYLPSLIGRARLVEGNAKLQTSHSTAHVAGPAVGGGLAQLAGAANAVIFTGVGYLASAVALLRIKRHEPTPTPRHTGRLRTDVAEGLRFVVGDKALRSIVCCTATGNLAGSAFAAVMVLFLVRHLGLSAGEAGLVIAAGGLGGVLGALVAGPCTRRIGQARAIWLVPLLTFPAQLLVAMAEPGWRVTLAIAGQIIFGIGVVVYNIAQVSYRQSICPDHLLGRMNASVRCIVWGTMPIGGLLGGALGSWLGVQTAVWITAAAECTAVLWVLCSPLRTMRELPASPREPATEPAP